MTSLKYESVYSIFLSSITDYHLLNESDTDIYNQFAEMLHKVVSRTYVRRLFSSFSMDDQNLLIEFELKHPSDENEDADFIANVLAKGMIAEWVEPQVNKTSLTAQFFGGKEQRYYSQSQHLAEMQSLLASSRLEVRKMIRERGYIYNPYLGDS